MTAVETIAEPLASLWTVLLQRDTPLSSRTRQKLGASVQVFSTWSVITTNLRAHGPHPFLLAALSPLLVATLNSGYEKLSTCTLNFWAVTFDLSDTISYPKTLVDTFRTFFQTSPRPHGLRLPGLESVSVDGGLKSDKTVGEVMSVEESIPMSDSEVVVLPNPSPVKLTGSPLKKVCSSFIGRTRDCSSSPSRSHLVSPHSFSPCRPCPVSPGSKSLDEVLKKSSPSVLPAVCPDLPRRGSVRRGLSLGKRDRQVSLV